MDVSVSTKSTLYCVFMPLVSVAMMRKAMQDHTFSDGTYNG
jgi:hypothetical protein